MAFKNTRFVYSGRNFTPGLTDVKATIRRDGALVASNVDLNDLGDGRYELLLTPALITTYGGSGFYDVTVDSATSSARGIAGRTISENDIDDVALLVNTNNGKINIIEGKIDALQADITSVKTTVEANNSILTDAGYGAASMSNRIDQVLTVAENISNVTRFNAPVPKMLLKQSSGTKRYKIPTRLMDTAGNMEDPDNSQISVSIVDESGNARDNFLVGFLSHPFYLTKESGAGDNTGKYFFEIDIPDTAGLEPVIFEFNFIEGGKEKSIVVTSEITLEAQQSGLALEATSQDIKVDTADMRTRVLDIQSVINHATNGLAPLRTLCDQIDANTNGVSGLLTDATNGLAAINTNILSKASQSSVNAISANIDVMMGTNFNSSNDSLHEIKKAIMAIPVSGGEVVAG